MSENEEQNFGMQFNSLMDFASFDSSELKAQMSRLPRQGIYVLNLKKLGFTAQPPSDPADPMSYQLGITSDILGFDALDPKETGDSPVGKDLTERYFLYGKDIREAIQLLMGRFKTIGLRYNGVLGGVEGTAPGWIDEAVGKRIIVRVAHYVDKNGQDRAAYNWLSPKQMEKIGLKWDDMMQRDFCDGDGNPVDVKAVAA